jgi:steroid delta-isomerase-like uncharacterized protein
MADDNVDTVRTVVSELWDRGNSRAVDEHYAENFTHRTPDLPPQVTSDRTGMKTFVELYASAFPGKRVNIEDEVAAGDRIVIRWTMRGAHEGDLMGIPASGADVTFEGMTLYRFENGKIVEEWTYGDMLGLMQQVGGMTAAHATGSVA